MSEVKARGPKQNPDNRTAAAPTASSSRRPGYAPVIDWIQAQITSGQVPVGARLPSIVDIAAACGVGVKTARSAVEQLAARGTLRTRQGSGTVVLAAPRDVPDGLARSGTGRRIIGTLVPNLTDYGETLSGIESVLAERGGRMLLGATRAGRDGDHLDSLIADGAEGVLYAGGPRPRPEHEGSFDRLRRLPVPCVLVDRRSPAGLLPRLPAVLTDLVHAAYVATDHLARLDRSRIAGIFPAGHHGEPELRGGYRAALASNGIRVDPALELAVPDRDAGHIAERLIECGADAAFIGDGRLAGAVLGELLRRDRRVPGDLALAAYDAHGGETAEIPLTSVSPRRASIGRLATGMLLDLLADPRTATAGEFLIHPPLIIRRSSVDLAT